MPVPLSAPGVNPTPDLQVRSLIDALTLPCSAHRQPRRDAALTIPQRCELRSAGLRAGTVRLIEQRRSEVLGEPRVRKATRVVPTSP